MGIDETNASIAGSSPGQYLTFHLAGEEYGVDILRVQEIRGWSPVTQVPNTPAAIQGVLNLRGAIVPILDLRLHFGLPRAEYTQTTVVVVLVTGSGARRKIFGIVVDGVSDVVTLASTEVQPPPNFGDSVQTEFISAMATVSERMVMLLDTERLMSDGNVDSALAA